MKKVSTGTKSLLFGVHQFLWHPIMVLRAWILLYGPPNFQETVCIFVHDWGYAGKQKMDGEDGLLHPELGARIAGRLFGHKYEVMVLGHSRNYSEIIGIVPSKLCWADKLSITYEPAWFYLLRAWASGELEEYRRESAKAKFSSMSESHKTWFAKLKNHFIGLAYSNQSGRSTKKIVNSGFDNGNKNLPIGAK